MLARRVELPCNGLSEWIIIFLLFNIRSSLVYHKWERVTRRLREEWERVTRRLREEWGRDGLDQ